MATRCPSVIIDFFPNKDKFEILIIKNSNKLYDNRM